MEFILKNAPNNFPLNCVFDVFLIIVRLTKDLLIVLRYFKSQKFLHNDTKNLNSDSLNSNNSLNEKNPLNFIYCTSRQFYNFIVNSV